MNKARLSTRLDLITLAPICKFADVGLWQNLYFVRISVPWTVSRRRRVARSRLPDSLFVTSLLPDRGYQTYLEQQTWASSQYAKRGYG